MNYAGGNQNFEREVVDLFIFRTNIDHQSQFTRVKKELQKLGTIQSCTIDLEDCDRVLRIKSENIPLERIVEKVVSHGFLCVELTD
jgi:hypothetical protein